MWSAVAYQRRGVSVNEKHCDWGSDELRDVVEQSAKYVAACHTPML